MLSAVDFAHLVGLVYDAAVEPDRWPGALAAVGRNLGYHHAILGLHELPSGRVLLDETASIPSPWAELRADYADDAMALWGGAEFIQSYPVDRPAVLSRINPGGLSNGSNRWAREWCAPQGIVDHLALVLARDGGAIGCVGMGRHSDAGLIGGSDIENARLFIPHLQRAAAIGRLLQAKQAANFALRDALDRLSAPVMLLSSDAAVLFANAAAESFLAKGEPLALKDGRLCFGSAALARGLLKALRCCDDNGAGLTPGGFGLPAHGRDGGVHALHLLPLGRSTPRPRLLPHAVAALFVSSPKARPGFVPDLVAALYGLTLAETRVCEKVHEGRTLPDIARLLGVSTSTVRTHLLHIFEKTGVHRQPDLIRLLEALTPPLAG